MIVLAILTYAVMYYVGRIYLGTEHLMREKSEDFDVRKAECGVASDQVLLLTSIRMQLGRSGGEQDRTSDAVVTRIPSAASIQRCASAELDQLDKFNLIVRRSLKEEVLAHSGRMLPYSMVAVIGVFGAGSAILPNLMINNDWNQVLYGAPWRAAHLKVIGKGVGTNHDILKRFLFDNLFWAPYSILVLFPLIFYVLTLFIRFLYLLETRWRVPWICNLVLTPVLCCLFQPLFKFVFIDFASYGVCFLWGVPWINVDAGLENALSATEPVTFEFFPLEDFFDCLDGGRKLPCLVNIRMQVLYTAGMQALALILVIFSVILVLIIHQPWWFRSFRRSAWRQILAWWTHTKTKLSHKKQKGFLKLKTN